MIPLVLTFYPPDWFIAVKNENEKAKQVEEVEELVKELEVKTRLYQKSISREALTGFLYTTSAKYGLNENKIKEIENTISGESGWDVSVDNGKSKGVSQFILETWLESCSDKDDREDAYKSIKCMVNLFSQGQEQRWDVWCDLYGKGQKRCERVNGINK